ncbi:MAG: protein kinase [Pirellulaceae bacterium]
MPHTDPSLSIAQRIDLACDRFESEWKAGKHPRITDFVSAARESDRVELRQALLAIELELRGRSEADTSVTQSSVRAPVDVSLAATALHAPTSSDVLKKIGRFDLRGVLGSGAFGKVYRAFDSKLNREVAIKVPMDSAVKTDAERVQFLKEARAIATINHPNVCQVFEVGEFEDRPYIVMALVPGLSLADALKSRKTPLPQKQVALIVRKIAAALAAAHEKGIVHRDLKPANIMFDRDRKDIVVMDFGLARGPQLADARSTQSGVIMGTPAYMSPEQARGDAKGVGPSGDVFSLGVILYEMLTGCRPFTGTATEVIGQILHVEPERPSKRCVGVDPRMESICQKAIAKDPAARYSTMKDFAAAIDTVLRGNTTPLSPGETARTEETRGLGERESAGDTNLADVFAVMSAERKKSQAETAAVVEAAIRKTHTPRWIFIALGLIGIFGIATLAGLIFFTKSGPVTVTVELNDIDLTDQSLSFFLDDQPISAEALANPIELKPGEHILVVKRGDAVVKRMRLNVTGGKNPGIKVKDITPETSPNQNIVWSTLIRSAEELIEGDTMSKNADGRSVKFQDGMLILNGANASFRPKFSGKNYIVRAKILQFSGQNVMFNVRRQPGRGYAAWFNNPDPGLDWPTYGLGKSMPGTPYTGLDGTMRRVSDDFPFEFAVAAFGDEITIFVNGVRVIHYKDTDSAEGSVSFALTGDSHAILRDPEICLLDGTELTPADIFPQKEDANLNRALTPEFLTDELKKGNLVKNGSFENSEKPMWSGDSWRKRPDCWRIVSGQSRGGQMSLHINNPESDDVTVTQTVAVKPGKRYLLSGWVKTENVRALETKSHGAYLYVSGGYDVQKTNLEGTKDWTYQAIVFRSLNRNSVSIAANLGNFASTATGKAWFDDLCVIELPEPTIRSGVEAASIKTTPALPMVGSDRRAAEWAIRANAPGISILADGVKVEIPKGGKLPDSPFTVIAINLSQCAGVTDEGIDRLKGLKDIRGLDIGYTSIKRLDFLDELLTLEHLVLSQTNIDDASLVHVKRLKNLRLLYLHTYWGVGNVTDAGIENLKGLSELRSLEIYGTRTTDAGLAHLSGLSNLEYLAFGSIENKSEITDRGLAHLAGLSNLKHLRINATQITDSGLEQIKKLPNLQVLQLVGTKITDGGLQHLGQFPALKDLYLQGTTVTDAGLEHLKSLSNLEALHLEDTKVTEAVLKSLQAALPNCKISK